MAITIVKKKNVDWIYYNSRLEHRLNYVFKSNLWKYL